MATPLRSDEHFDRIYGVEFVEFDEISTPAADTGKHKLYAKSDDRVYHQDGAGVETELAVRDTDSGEMAITSNQTVTIETADTPIAIKDFSTGLVNNWSFVAGKTGAITAYADHSGTVGGTVKATSATHNLTTGDFITIRGTTNYNGVFEITTIDTDNFYITVGWVSDNGASDWEMGAYMLVASGAEGDYTIDWNLTLSEDGGAGSTGIFRVYVDTTILEKAVTERKFANNDVGAIPGGAHVTIVASDRVWMAFLSSGTNNFTIKHLNLRLHRLG